MSSKASILSVVPVTSMITAAAWSRRPPLPRKISGDLHQLAAAGTPSAERP